MNPFSAKKTVRNGPEQIIQDAIITKLRKHDWFTQVIIGNAIQHGLPDLFVSHARLGMKWIEVKNPKAFSFTERQQQKFPLMHAAGVGIWVLFSDHEDELFKITKPPNWFEIMFRWQHGAMR